MKVSVITACFNSQTTILETLQSVFNQTYPNVEYIIVDGQSTDQTLEIIKRNSGKIEKIISEPDNGIYDALNKGIAHATGDIIAFLHADDFYAHPQVISNYVEVFIANDCDGVYADLQYVNRHDTNKVIRNWISGDYRHGAFLWGWMPPHPTLFLRREVYRRYGGFNLSLKSAADYEFMLRVIHKNRIKLAYLPQVTVKMRVGGTSNKSLKNRLRANYEDRMAWQLNNLKPYFFTLLLKPLRKLGQFF